MNKLKDDIKPENALKFKNREREKEKEKKRILFGKRAGNSLSHASGLPAPPLHLGVCRSPSVGPVVSRPCACVHTPTPGCTAWQPRARRPPSAGLHAPHVPTALRRTCVGSSCVLGPPRACRVSTNKWLVSLFPGLL